MITIHVDADLIAHADVSCPDAAPGTLRWQRVSCLEEIPADDLCRTCGA